MNKRTAALLVLLCVLWATAASAQESNHPAMRDPSKAADKAPDKFTAVFETTKGEVVFECDRSWAPHGVDRFYNLVKIGYFHDNALFRVKKGFVVQWGIHGNPDVSKHWRNANLAVDPVKQSNTKGMLSFAMAGSPTTRSTQLFINYGNNTNLDRMGFAPLCKVAAGMEIVEAFHGEYGEKPSGQQGRIQSEGNAFLKAEFPNLDYIKKTSIKGEAPAIAQAPATKDEGDNTLAYVAIAVLAIGAFFFIMRKREDSEAPPPKKKAKQAGKKTKKKTAAKKTTKAKKKKKKKTSKKKKKAAKKTSED